MKKQMFFNVNQFSENNAYAQNSYTLPYIRGRKIRPYACCF